MNYLFLDTNIYLKFFLGNKLLKALESILENKANLVVTQQIVDEVLRNSVSSTAQVLQNSIKDRNWNKPSIPFRMEDRNLANEIDILNKQVKDLVQKLESEFKVHLEKISKRSDDVSIKLIELFNNPLIPTAEEVEEAKKIKAFGNPPGKKADPIGDELSWVQLNNKLKTGDKLILVTNDRDYATVFRESSILNSKLAKDLEEKEVGYFVFSEVMDGIKKLKELQELAHQDFESKDFPEPNEQVEILNEEKSIHIIKDINECSHSRYTKIMNGIYDQYRCLDCNTILGTYLADDLD